MMETYKAKIRGDHVVWNGEAPGKPELESERDVLITLLPKNASSAVSRPSGLAAGEFVVPDDFDAPLPPELIAEFEN